MFKTNNNAIYKPLTKKFTINLFLKVLFLFVFLFFCFIFLNFGCPGSLCGNQASLADSRDSRAQRLGSCGAQA